MYRVNEIFYTLQGEGIRQGAPSVFIRFSGCNLACKKSTHGFDCDTEFVSGRPMTKEEILLYCRKMGGSCCWIVCTGGEPLLQLDLELSKYLRENGYYLAVETNGTQSVSGIQCDWITVSPKVAEHAVVQLIADEVKYVRHAGQGIPKPACDGKYKLLSPASTSEGIDPEALAWCIKLVKENPEWRLTTQAHKTWGVR